MPDNDNIARKHPKGWGRCPDAAFRGSDTFAQYVHHLVAKEIRTNKNVNEALALLEQLLPQVHKIATLPLNEQLVTKLKLPKGAESTRQKLMAVRAIQRIVVELSYGDNASSKEVRSRAFKELCLEIARVNAFGPLLTSGIPFPYRDVDVAQQNLEDSEAKLSNLIDSTASELAASSDTSKVTAVKAPAMPKRSQEELLEEDIAVNL